MQTNNARFLLGMEWRYWQGQRVKLLFLLLGFALMCALLSLLLRFGDVLFSEPPVWAKPTGHVYTFAREHADGRLSPLHRLALERMEEAPGVHAQTSIYPTVIQLTFPEQPIEALQSIHFADNFGTLLNIPELQDPEAHGVWLSERYFREHWQNNPAVLTASLHHARIPNELPILGVLPPTLNRIGNIQPDIWLSQRYLRYQTPFIDERQSNRFLSAAPYHFGFLFSHQPLDIGNLNAYLSTQDLTVPGMNMGSDGSAFVIHSGINLDPLAKQRLFQQWQLLLVLIIAFVIVLSLNTFSMFTSRLLQQANNYRIQRILGANVPQLLRGSWYSCAVMIIGVGLSSLLLLWFFSYSLSQQTAFVETVGNTHLTINGRQWLAALSFVALLLLLCASLPMLRITRQPLFGRQTGESRSKGQKWLAQINLSSQLFIALVAVSFIGSLGYQQWQLFQSYELNTEVKTFHIRQMGRGFNLAALTEGNVAQVNGGEVAFAVGDFTNTQTTELDDDRLAEPIPVQRRLVSGNYFQLLATAVPDLPADWEHGVVINQSLATMLEYNTSSPIVGSTLDTKLGFSGSLPIVGITANIPHQGFSQTSAPAMYVHHQSSPFMMQNMNSLELYYSANHAERLYPALQGWLEETTQQPQISAQLPLATIIAHQDRASRSLLLFCAIMIVLVITIVFTSLRYQIRNRMILERQEYGVLLAIGAPDWRLFWRASYQALGAFCVAIPAAMLALAWLLNDTGWLSSFELLFSAPLFIIGVLILLLLTLIAAQLPVWQLYRQSIFSLLRTH